jgi:murein DD-endopeptidase MepM/ murein hydrolase activator NlpD
MNVIQIICILFSFYFIPIQHGCGNIVYYPVGKDAIISQQFGYKHHVGIDFNVPTGTPVHAVLDGTVIFAMEDSVVYGRSIIIMHDDGYESLYGHLSKLLVKKDEKVYAGKIIGLSGGLPDTNGAGWSSGAHLHFEIRIPNHLDNNLYNTDPIEYLNQFSTEFSSYPCPI